MENHIRPLFNFLFVFFFSFTFISIGLICVFPVDLYGQKLKDTNLDQANKYFETDNWPLAILAFESYLTRHPDHIPSRIKLGKALMNVHRMEDSLHEWTSLIQNSKEVPAEVYFLAGRSSHQLGLFSEAEEYYRKYILHKKEGVDLELISYYLKQIGAAKSAGVAGSQYLIENTGPLVNSELDEFHPVYSPNFDQRFYYSIHDEKADNPVHSSTSMFGSVLYAEVEHGEWLPQGPMDTSLVKYKDVQLLDFSTDGMHVFYTYPSSAGGRTTYLKSYDIESSRPQISKWFHPIFKSILGDRDLFVIHDSAYLFSSNRLEGFGGYDLYVTFKRMGQWVVQNLGASINSSYDEITPYLCQDGRTIFFSSNSDKSIGGYDIFFTTFDDNMETWTSPSNMQPPMNSGMNDVELRMSKDGSSVIFSSNRPQGYGGYDIYHVYFNQKLQSQIPNNQPRYFYQVQAYRMFASESNVSKSKSDKPIYDLPVVYFGMRPVVITPKIKSQLDDILKYGQLFPHTSLLLNVFTDQPWDTALNLYQPALILNNITDYLKNHGLNPARIQLRLFGNQYPRYTAFKDSYDHKKEPVGSFNRRLEFGFTDTENLPVQFGSSPNMQDDSESISPYVQWKNRTKDLHFRIQLVESKQLLKGIEMNQDEDLMLTIDEGSKVYRYYVGVFQQVADARKKLSQFTAEGYENAEIVAFLGVSRLATYKITANMIEAYPELKKYIIYQK